MSISFEWDEKKNQVNLKKHKIDFEDVVSIFDGFVYEQVDDRKDYGETRIIAFGECNNQVLCVVYTERKKTKRIISARKASSYERKEYYKEKFEK
jgi:uncharacterized DUF497 family protein